jgi:hypothetical protein
MSASGDPSPNTSPYPPSSPSPFSMFLPTPSSTVTHYRAGIFPSASAFADPLGRGWSHTSSGVAASPGSTSGTSSPRFVEDTDTPTAPPSSMSSPDPGATFALTYMDSEHDDESTPGAAPHIPRPPNAFILFRASFIKSSALGALAGATSPAELSRLAGRVWHALPPKERKRWEDRAEDALRRHRERYPEWRWVGGRGKWGGADRSAGGSRKKGRIKDGGGGEKAGDAGGKKGWAAVQIVPDTTTLVMTVHTSVGIPPVRSASSTSGEDQPLEGTTPVGPPEPAGGSKSSARERPKARSRGGRAAKAALLGPRVPVAPVESFRFVGASSSKPIGSPAGSAVTTPTHSEAPPTTFKFVEETPTLALADDAAERRAARTRRRQKDRDASGERHVAAIVERVVGEWAGERDGAPPETRPRPRKRAATTVLPETAAEEDAAPASSQDSQRTVRARRNTTAAAPTPDPIMPAEQGAFVPLTSMFKRPRSTPADDAPPLPSPVPRALMGAAHRLPRTPPAVPFPSVAGLSLASPSRRAHSPASRAGSRSRGSSVVAPFGFAPVPEDGFGAQDAGAGGAGPVRTLRQMHRRTRSTLEGALGAPMAPPAPAPVAGWPVDGDMFSGWDYTASDAGQLARRHSIAAGTTSQMALPPPQDPSMGPSTPWTTGWVGLPRLASMDHPDEFFSQACASGNPACPSPQGFVCPNCVGNMLAARAAPAPAPTYPYNWPFPAAGPSSAPATFEGYAQPAPVQVSRYSSLAGWAGGPASDPGQG